MKILLTGNCGFIGQNFVRLFKDDYEIIGVDKLGYASDKNAMELCKSRISDIYLPHTIEPLFDMYQPDYVINCGAESHVDNSIKSPKPFIMSNIVGTFNILEMCKKYNVKRLLQVSTDEVLGDLEENDLPFSNDDLLKPSSPYSASKASADLLVLSYVRTFGIDAVITRSCNNYGPYQYYEKFIPVVINSILNNKQIPIYGTGSNKREWIHVRDNCNGLMKALINGKSGSIYNLGSGFEIKNIDMVKTILQKMNVNEDLISFVEDRKGHDKRYFMNSEKSYRELDWKPEINFKDGIEETIRWYVENQNYWEQ